MQVICENCEKESNEENMGADCRQTDEDEDEVWSNHICPHCNFWNFTPAVWSAENDGLELVDLRILDNL